MKVAPGFAFPLEVVSEALSKLDRPLSCVNAAVLQTLDLLEQGVLLLVLLLELVVVTSRSEPSGEQQPDQDREQQDDIRTARRHRSAEAEPVHASLSRSTCRR